MKNFGWNIAAVILGGVIVSVLVAFTDLDNKAAAWGQ